MGEEDSPSPSPSPSPIVTPFRMALCSSFHGRLLSVLVMWGVGEREGGREGGRDGGRKGGWKGGGEGGGCQ